jgi:hypothetical protein
MAWWTIDAARDLSSRVAGAAAWVTWGRHGRTPCRWERREAGDSVQPPLPSDSDPLWTVICRLRSVVGQYAQLSPASKPLRPSITTSVQWQQCICTHCRFAVGMQ